MLFSDSASRNKTRLTVSVDPRLLDKAAALGIDLSTTLEEALVAKTTAAAWSGQHVQTSPRHTGSSAGHTSHRTAFDHLHQIKHIASNILRTGI